MEGIQETNDVRINVTKTQKEIDLFVRNEQMALEKTMEKSGREDIWFGDIETAIIRTIEWLKGEKLDY